MKLEVRMICEGCGEVFLPTTSSTIPPHIRDMQNERIQMVTDESECIAIRDQLHVPPDHAKTILIEMRDRLMRELPHYQEATAISADTDEAITTFRLHVMTERHMYSLTTISGDLGGYCGGIVWLRETTTGNDLMDGPCTAVTATALTLDALMYETATGRWDAPGNTACCPEHHRLFQDHYQNEAWKAVLYPPDET